MIRKITELLKIPESVRIPYFGGKWYRLLCKLDNISIIKEKLPQIPLNKQKRDIKIIASLTSFPARIDCVHLAIKSIMLQTVKPDRIVLWLAEEQFPNKKLPDSLTNLIPHGLEICWMNDIHAHKKYYYTIISQAENEVVISFDDDIIYSSNCIKRLIETYRKHPNCLICERGQVLSYDKDGNPLKNPGRWKTISSKGVKSPTFSMNPSPGGGCLIPKNAFYIDATNEEKIRKLAYRADDLWYMFMCAQNGTRMIKTRKYHKTFSVIDNSQTIQIATVNVLNDGNKIFIEGLIKAYPEAWKRILTDKE